MGKKNQECNAVNKIWRPTDWFWPAQVIHPRADPKFLVQTVRDPGGFDKLTTILEKEVKDNISRRGSEAWKALRDHYH